MVKKNFPNTTIVPNSGFALDQMDPAADPTCAGISFNSQSKNSFLMTTVFRFPYLKLISVCAAIGIFSFFIHHSLPIQLLSFVALTIYCFCHRKRQQHYRNNFRTRTSNIKLITWVIISSLVSFFLVKELRKEAHLQVLPSTLASFAAVAILIE
jgi:hypothetical protein